MALQRWEMILQLEDMGIPTTCNICGQNRYYGHDAGAHRDHEIGGLKKRVERLEGKSS